jgi:predicted  nucleic acid-binding Zn-ribbon protein
MKKETKIQLEGELTVVESEIHKLEYHLVGLDNEKRKTKLSLEVLKKQKEKLKSYL